MRRFITESSIVGLVLCGTTVAWAVDESRGLVLVEQGKPAATIVTAEKPTENARVAATELQKYVKKISGATLAITTDAASPSGALILIGRSRLTDGMPNVQIPAGRTRNLREEGFVVKTTNDRLVLAGNDEDPYLGTRYAVIELLHRLGVRWFMPGEMGEIVPNMTTIAVQSTDVTQRPDFPVRTFWEHARDKMGEEETEWKIHNKMNTRSVEPFGVPGDGSISGFLPPKEVFTTHPDWFALTREGTRDQSHPCTTSEEMIQYIAGKIKTQAKAGQKLTAFAPNDGNPRCWCKRCEALGNGFDGYGANERDPVPEASVSNEWFYFVNRILTEVNKEFPDFILATNGYANRDIPPELPPDVVFNPDHNLVVMFANIGACTIHAYDDPKCYQMKRQGQMLRQWCRVCDKVWVYNYNYTMAVNNGTITPMVHRLRRNMPLLKEWGVIGFNDQDECNWGFTGIPTRVIRAALEWDVKADVDAILEDFYTKWFGTAAAPMKTYYETLENAFEQTPEHGHEDIILPAIYTDELMSKLEPLIVAAESAARTDTEKAHVRIERAMYDHLGIYRAMYKAQAAGDLKEAARQATGLVNSEAEMNKLSPFLGWEPYPVYGADYEKARRNKLAELVGGPGGDLVALLPEEMAFRTDPNDDGRFERWQDDGMDLSGWKRIKTTLGWESQGFRDGATRPYRGIGWYVSDMDVPAAAKGRNVVLYGPSVVNEAWVWVNGRYAGHRPYMMPWFRPHQMELDVSKLLRPGEKNRIAIRVLCNFDVWGANGIDERMFLYAPKPAVKSASAR